MPRVSFWIDTVGIPHPFIGLDLDNGAGDIKTQEAVT
jgi:hypothetical protein